MSGVHSLVKSVPLQNARLDPITLVKVTSHLDNPKVNGLIVIKSLTQASGGKSKWLGQMYDASIDGFVPVKLALNGCSEVNISNNGSNILTLIRE